jgi:hypothetical protein
MTLLKLPGGFMCPPDEFLGEQTAFVPEAPGRGRFLTEKKFPDETLAAGSDRPSRRRRIVHVTLYPYRVSA